MKKITKVAFGLCLAVCALLVMANLDFLPTGSVAVSLMPNHVRKPSTGSSQQKAEVNPISTRHRTLLSEPKKEQKERTKAPKRNWEQDRDNPEEEEDSSSDVKEDRRKTPATIFSQPQRTQDNSETRKAAAEKTEPLIVEAAAGWSVPSQRVGENLLDTRRTGMVVGAKVPETRSAAEVLKNMPRYKEGNGVDAGKSQPVKKIDVGHYVDWWTDSWQRSVVFKLQDQFVGDKPLFNACTSNPLKSTYPFVEPAQYLPSEVSKNPCWYQIPRAKKGLRCVPYVYLAGVAKCGTSDLAKRLRMHPEVFESTNKEYHWWERARFGMYDEDNPEKTVNIHGGQSFREYTQQITGKGILDLQKELKENGSSVRIFGDYSPSYLWDNLNWYALDGNQGCTEPRIVIGHHIRHVYPQAKIIMTFRHPTSRLYSRFMSRIHRTPDLRKATNADFHRYVRNGTQLYRKCFLQHSVRQCAYNSSLFREIKVRLTEGMYPVYMADWLRIWPREQMFIMRYEDYGGHERERIQEVIQFLGLRTLSKKEMDKLMEIDVVNSGSLEYQKYGGMLPETKKLLDDFYQPFVQQFAQLLNEERFLWKDVYQ